MSQEKAKTEGFDKMVAENIWHSRDSLEALITFLKDVRDNNQKWSWVNNPKCKYIGIRIDMRDQGFVLTDRDGKRISLTDLKYQWKPDQLNQKESK